MPKSLPRKLRLVFTLQAVTASLAVFLGLYFAGVAVKDVLTAERLRVEAESWWSGRARDPDHPLPRTSTVNGYFAPAGVAGDQVPVEIRHLPVGIHDVEVPDRAHRVLVDERPEGRLYLRMSFRLVDNVVWWTNLVSMVLALLAIVSVSWLSYRSSKRLVTPVNRLARAVSRWDPLAPDVDALVPETQEAGTEVAQLGGALRDLALRTQQFVQRERDFTRDASHELRTPLTVIRVATDMMRSDAGTPERMQRPLQRIQRAGQDMEAVIDAFLILARESEVAPQVEDFEVADVVYEAVDKARPLLTGKPVAMAVVESARPRLRAAPRVLTVMLDNLLSNACAFTEEGRIEVRLERDRVVVHDTGIGMDEQTLQRVYEPFYRADQFGASGKGMGLSIVRRLGDRFGWPVALQSAPGEGTTATIHFDRFAALG
jgi:signal transduction histidine kinase